MTRRLARIFPRLLLFNVLLVFLPAAGLFYLDTYETQLLKGQERSMVQQGRLLAAALGGSGPLDGPAAVTLLERLERRVDARLRIIGADGSLLADSSLLGPRRAEGASSPEPLDRRASMVYRIGAEATLFVQRLLGRGAGAELESSEVYAGLKRLDGTEVRAALAGRYGATTRISSGGQRSVTLYSAIPVRSNGEVVGAVLVSQSTSRLLAALVEVRLDIFRTFLVSVAVAVVLSLLFAATIARPLFKLQRQAAAIVDRRGRLKRRFEGSKRHDEIGELARALQTLTERIEGHQERLEAFASDVAHELKNPLASIRTATELLDEIDDPAERRNFIGMIERDVARMEHVLSEVRELALFGAGGAQPAAAVDLAQLAGEIVDGYRAREGDHNRLQLDVPAEAPQAAIQPEHFARILTNLLDNALSFAPAGTPISVRLGATESAVTVEVGDEGPGIDAAEVRRVFDRFYSARPAEHSGNGHLGLGLSIVRAVAQSYGGEVRYQPRSPRGSLFFLTLPRARGSAPSP